MTVQVDADRSKNKDGVCQEIGTPLTQPRSLSDLRSFLHGYRIKAGEDLAKTVRAGIIIDHIDLASLLDGVTGPHAHRAARELAELDPSLSWLPGWKPRERVAARSS